MSQRMRIGIDVGGTKIEGILLAGDGRELARHREPTPQAYDEVLRAIAGVVARLEAGGTDGAPATVGVGTPGVLHPSRGVMLNSNLACLNDRPLDHDLTVALGRPVRLANDG
jgi:fructokinase